jgi:GNAT superfamily N-acetyltransferase
MGCGALELVGHQTFQIKRMFVLPAARRRGVASALLAALEEQAVRCGARWIVLETGPMQPEAVNLYLRHGYGPIPRPDAQPGSRRSLCFGRAAPQAALP